MVSRKEPWSGTIYGEPVSKANSRRFVVTQSRLGTRTPRLIKSEKALDYCRDFYLQCPILRPMFLGDVTVRLFLYYTSRRPDLDESIVLDAMQKRIYRNDRQVKRKIVEWGIDPGNPRAEITVFPYLREDAGQFDQRQ